MKWGVEPFSVHAVCSHPPNHLPKAGIVKQDRPTQVPVLGPAVAVESEGFHLGKPFRWEGARMSPQHLENAHSQLPSTQWKRK